MMKSIRVRKIALGATVAAAALVGAGASQAFATTIPYQGGTWQYGETNSAAGHECYSYFLHASDHYAGASLVAGPAQVKSAGPGAWAYATVWGASDQACRQEAGHS